MSAPSPDAKRAFKERVRRWADQLGVEVKGVALRPMVTKWASYSTSGNVTFDVDVLALEPELADYVVVHELLHCHAPNHGKLWKSLMTAHLGDHERLAARLRDRTRSRSAERS